MTKNILLCGFQGNNNTAKLVLDKLPFENKLYLENDFDISVKQLLDLMDHHYDFIIMFGQKPVIKSLYIETQGRDHHDIRRTNYNVDQLASYFKKAGYKCVVSHHAGNYLCNNLYYHCLKYIDDYRINTNAVFLHIPTLKNIFDIDIFVKDLYHYFMSDTLK